MIRKIAMLWLAICASATLSAAQASEKGWDDAGSVARTALVAAAIGIPAVQDDWDGALQGGGSVLAASLVTTGMKETFPRLRPDGSDDKSFPSGHTSVSFAAAASLHNRYGWEVGIPAQLVAAFVGLSRVEAKRHHVSDVLVGAAIGEAAGFLITSKKDENVRIFPWGDTKGAGVTMVARF
ncbi:MAG: phosphatase PAP2 family protein [Blastomonas sp.]